MMTAVARQRQSGRLFGTVTRTLLPFVLALSVAVLFAMVWQSAGEQSAFATLERDGVRYIQTLEPLEIALTNAESAAVNGRSESRDALAKAIDAVAVVDNEFRGRLGTQDRWAGLRTKIGSLPTGGTDAAVIAAYGSADDLLLALMDRVRNTSKLIRDPAADIYYLEDGAAQELPEGIVAAAHYTDLLVSLAGRSAADRAAAAVDLNSAGSDLASNAHDLSDDIRLAVEGTGSRNLGSALLSKLDRFNRSIDNLTPLMTPVLAGKAGADAAQVVRAHDEMQAAGAALSQAVLAQIDTELRSELSSLDHRRLLALGALVVPVLLVLVPIGQALVARRRRATATPEQDRPGMLEQDRPGTPPPSPERPEPAYPATVAPNRWPVDPVPPQWPESRPQGTADPEYARSERFGAPQ